jgi:hypothetical protein
MMRKLQALVSVVSRARQGGDGHVHFHQGPQSQPTPCFDERCPNPRLPLAPFQS